MNIETNLAVQSEEKWQKTRSFCTLVLTWSMTTMPLSQ